MPLLKRSTWMGYDGVVRLHLTPVFGVRPLHAISRSDVKTLALNLRRQGLGPKSVREIVGVLSTILNEAVDDQLIPSNPALGLRKVYRSPDFANAGPDTRNVNPLTRDDIAHRTHHRRCAPTSDSQRASPVACPTPTCPPIRIPRLSKHLPFERQPPFQSP